MTKKENHDLFDICIIGGGPGGYVAALRASQLGLKTVLVEKEHLGGICLNWGCIPTKALLHCAHVYETAKKATDFGVSCNNVDFSLDDMVAYSRRVSKRLTNGVGFLLKKNKVTVIEGTARLGEAGDSAGQVNVTSKEDAHQTIAAKHIILATGARARALPNIDMRHKTIWTYKDALAPDMLPKRLAVIGSGAIGMEFASFYNSLGCEVSVIEMADHIMPNEDHEISSLAEAAFKKQGIHLHKQSRTSEIAVHDEDVSISIQNHNGDFQTLDVDRMIVAIGIVPNVEGLSLEDHGIELEKGFVKVDGFCRTSAKGYYAIGDLAGGPCLAHKASHEAVQCVEKIAGLDVHPMDKGQIPACTYTHPQVASVGLSEAAAKAQYGNIAIGHFPFAGNGKAIAQGNADGLIKTIFNKDSGELLGAHMIGDGVTELISNYVLAKSGELTEIELVHTIFPHPTLSEMLHESVLDAFDKALHI